MALADEVVKFRIRVDVWNEKGEILPLFSITATEGEAAVEYEAGPQGLDLTRKYLESVRPGIDAEYDAKTQITGDAPPGKVIMS